MSRSWKKAQSNKMNDGCIPFRCYSLRGPATMHAKKEFQFMLTLLFLHVFSHKPSLKSKILTFILLTSCCRQIDVKDNSAWINASYFVPLCYTSKPNYSFQRVHKMELSLFI